MFNVKIYLTNMIMEFILWVRSTDAEMNGIHEKEPPI